MLPVSTLFCVSPSAHVWVGVNTSDIVQFMRNLGFSSKLELMCWGWSSKPLFSPVNSLGPILRRQAGMAVGSTPSSPQSAAACPPAPPPLRPHCRPSPCGCLAWAWACLGTAPLFRAPPLVSGSPLRPCLQPSSITARTCRLF